MIRPHRSLYMIGLIMISTLLGACGNDSPSAPPINTTTNLPNGKHLLIGASIAGSDRGAELLFLTPDDPNIQRWTLQDGRGLTENGSSGRSAEDFIEWDPANRSLMMSGIFGEQSGLHRISSDGKVTALAALGWASEVGGELKTVLRGGAVETPRAVQKLSYFKHAHSEDSFAFAGTIYTNPGVIGNARDAIYVVDAQNTLTAYGEAMNLSDIADIRWSPDDTMISFTAIVAAEDTSNRYVFRLDIRSGAIAQINTEATAQTTVHVLSGSSAEFTSDNGIIFAGTPADESTAPAFYFVAADEATAVPLVLLADIPQIDTWDGTFLLSPDEMSVAFEGSRDTPTTPWTIYTADLDNGTIRDLLSPDLQVARTGNTQGAAAPYMTMLNWSSDSSALLFASSLTGNCDTNNLAGVSNCTTQLFTVAANGGMPDYLSSIQFESIWFAFWTE